MDLNRMAMDRRLLLVGELEAHVNNGGFSQYLDNKGARTLREAAWAPLAVLLLAWMVGRLPIARDLWWLFHVFGGAALAFFCAHAMTGASRATRYVSAFAFAIAGAVAWELAEFAWDQAFGTRLQEGRADTVSDLFFSACGAALYLSFAALPGRERQAGDQAAR